jgi:hypothetical protein
MTMKLFTNRFRLQLFPVIVLWLLFASGIHPTKAGQPTSAVGGGPKITDLRAFLYYHDKGEFDRRDLLAGFMALRNVFIGEGDAESPSGSMLVLVGLQHSSFTVKILTGMHIKLTVKAPKRTLLNQDISLMSFFSEKSKIEVPFMVHGIACERLEIVAKLTTGSRELGSLTRTAPFQCGE